MEPYGHIVAHRHYNVLGLEAIDYEWEGGKVALLGEQWVPLPGHLNVGDRFNLGPWRLRVVDWDWSYLAVIVTRDGWQAWREIAYRTVTRHVARFWGRLIITAAVWGLASWKQGQMPSWRQVYLLAWLARPFRA